MAQFRILLLTNRDSDNVGDQLIEATAISLITAAMANLGVDAADHTIVSRSAGIIPRRYIDTRDPQLLERARLLISRSDVVIFGGAPLFNYAYQDFYLRTIETIQIAQELGVPVLFSSIGVEPFDPTNQKCLDLRAALQLPVVRQLTTRDDIDSVRHYMAGTAVPVAQVADPVVFADLVFRQKPPAPAAPPKQPTAPPRPLTPVVRLKRTVAALPLLGPVARRVRRLLRPAAAPGTQPATQSATRPVTKPATQPATQSAAAKPRRIGLVVTRANIFRDNGIEFSEDDQRRFWLGVIERLVADGFEPSLFTTGHFTDEVFLDALMRDHPDPRVRVTPTVNSPEELIAELRGCAGIIAYRLHASVTSYAFEIPTIGLTWNVKVPYFYESIGYPGRALSSPEWTADTVVTALYDAMAAGVQKDIPFCMSVYETLFTGLKGIIAPSSDAVAFDYPRLRAELPRYPGTSLAQYRVKMTRKLRRIYPIYQVWARRATEQQAARP